MDALVLQHGRIHYSCWTGQLRSLDASTEVARRAQSGLRLRPSIKGLRSAVVVDALGSFEKRVQTRPHCVHQLVGRVRWGDLCVIVLYFTSLKKKDFILHNPTLKVNVRGGTFSTAGFYLLVTCMLPGLTCYIMYVIYRSMSIILN